MSPVDRICHRPWGLLLLSLALGGIGIVCVLSGLALLALRLTRPEQAIILLPDWVGTPVDTPTPGILGTPLPKPPRPEDGLSVAILPISERPTATPTPLTTAWPSHQPTASASQPIPITRSPTATSTPAPPRTTPQPARPSPTPTTHPARSPFPPTRPALRVETKGAPSAPTRIRIDRIAVDAPVVPVGQHAITVDGELYSQWDVPPTRAAGWHQTSAPLGQAGNTVLNGHHNVYGEVFRYLNVLEPGDIIALEDGSRRHTYIVAQTMTLPEAGQPIAVRQENARWILPTDDERVTLVTCWPYFSNTHRLVVVALPLWDVIPPAEIP